MQRMRRTTAPFGWRRPRRQTDPYGTRIAPLLPPGTRLLTVLDVAELCELMPAPAPGAAPRSEGCDRPDRTWQRGAPDPARRRRKKPAPRRSNRAAQRRRAWWASR